MQVLEVGCDPAQWYDPLALHVPHMCPAAAPNAGTGRDHVEREGTRFANSLAAMKGNGASRQE